jgi:uncharacterized protein DUF1573
MSNRTSIVLASSTAFLSLVLWLAYVRTAPTVTLTVSQHDLGTIVRGKVERLALEYSSTGLRRGSVNVKSTSCGCTAAVASSEGKQGGRVDVEIATANLPEGPQEKSVTLATNDPARPSITVAIRFSVVSEFVVESRLIDFGDVRAGSVVRDSIRVRPNKDLGARITGFNLEGSGIVAATPATTGDSEDYVVQVELRQDVPRGVHFATGIIRTSSESTPEIRVPIRVRIQ